MTDRPGAVTFQSLPLTLTGQQIDVGDTPADCELLANDISPVKLSSYHGRVAVVCSVPSLDTPVCDVEIKRFNEEAVSLGDDVVVLAVSMDLPFAQARWCGSANATNIVTLSDHRQAAFGQAFGVLIKELRLLARAVFVLDREGVARDVQIVKELTSQPDYASVLEAVKKAR